MTDYLEFVGETTLVVDNSTEVTEVVSVIEEVHTLLDNPATTFVVVENVIGSGGAGTPGADGDDGREVELQNSGTHVQWRYVGDATWTDLVALSELEGDPGSPGAAGTNGQEVSLQTSATHIQWRLGTGSWTDLVALEDLKGEDGAGGGTTTWDGITDKPTEFPPSAHNHAASEITSGTFLEARIPTLAQSKITNLTTDLAGKASTVHSHVIADVTGLQAALDGKQASGSYANASHTHTASQVTDFDTAVDARIENIIGTAPAALDTLGEIADALGDDEDFAATITTALAGKASTTHGHTISDVTGLQAALDAKVPTTRTINGQALSANVTLTPDNFTDGTTNHVFTAADDTKLGGIATGATANSSDATLLARANHTGSQAISTITGLQTALDGKAATSHTHTIANVTGLQTALDGKQASGSYAAASHSHTISDITSLQTTLDGKLSGINNNLSLTTLPTDHFARIDIIGDGTATGTWPDRFAFYFTPQGGSAARTGYHNEYGELRARPATASTVPFRVMTFGSTGGSSNNLFEVTTGDGSTQKYFTVSQSDAEFTVPVTAPNLPNIVVDTVEPSDPDAIWIDIS